MRQVGIVVRDIEAAMRHWVQVCGVGPWFYTDRSLMGVVVSRARPTGSNIFLSQISWAHSWRDARPFAKDALARP